jgi:hypothetical protein
LAQTSSDTQSGGGAVHGAPGARGGAAGPPTGAPPGAQGGGPPPLPVLLGFAELMLTLDRPYEAEKIYKGILTFDPKNAAALAGLRVVEIAKKPTMQLLTHYYNDNHDVEMFTYGGGPTFRTRYGRITLTSGTGTYRNNNDPNNKHNPLSLTPMVPTAADNHSLQKSTVNLILEPFHGRWDGTILVSRVIYDGAPDRTLWDLRATYTTDLRTSYTVTHGRHDSFYQNQADQFFAPENYFMLTQKISFQDTSLTVLHPIVGKIDLQASYRYFSYSDGNTRDNYRALTMYRLKGTQKHPMPIFRVGLDTILDNSKFFTLLYSSSRQFNALSLASDYLWVTRREKIGVFASYPIAKQHFNPPAAFVGFYNRQLTDRFNFYVNVVGFWPPDDGVSIKFGDYIMGVNMSF